MVIPDNEWQPAPGSLFKVTRVGSRCYTLSSVQEDGDSDEEEESIRVRIGHKGAQLAKGDLCTVATDDGGCNHLRARWYTVAERASMIIKFLHEIQPGLTPEQYNWVKRDRLIPEMMWIACNIATVPLILLLPLLTHATCYL